MNNCFDMKKYLILSAISIFALLEVKAQSCAELLQDAQTRYEDGKVHEIEGVLMSKKAKTCYTWKEFQAFNNVNVNPEDQFTQEEESQAYRMMSQSYLQLNLIDKADKMLYYMLEINPEYAVNPAVDPAEFINLYNTWRTKPIFRIGMKGGALASEFYNKSFRSVWDAARVDAYTPSPQFGLAMEFDISDIITKNKLIKDKYMVSAELIYHSIKITDTNPDLDNIENLEIVYSYNSLDLRGIMSYGLLQRPKVQLLANLGFAVEYYLDINAQLTNGQLTAYGGENMESTNRDISYMYKNFNASAFGGTNFRLKVGRPWLTLDLRYHYHLVDPLISSEIYTEPSEQFNFVIVPNNGFFSHLNASLGVVVPVFKHVKLLGVFNNE